MAVDKNNSVARGSQKKSAAAQETGCGVSARSSWKISDILNFDVFDDSGVKLGVLAEIFSTGSNDVWIVRDGEKEILVPALKSVVKKVLLGEKKILLDLPDGCSADSLPKPVDKSARYDGYKVYED